jgi:hypothetical protein
MKLNELNIFGHSAIRRRYLNRFPSQYFRNEKPFVSDNKPKKKKKHKKK